MIVTKFDGNLMKYVEEETNCQKERRRKKKRQDPSKLGDAA